MKVVNFIDMKLKFYGRMKCAVGLFWMGFVKDDAFVEYVRKDVGGRNVVKIR